MNIIYIISTLEKSGPVGVLFNIIQHLPPDCNVSIIVLKKTRKDSLDSIFEKMGVHIFHLDMGRYNVLSAYKATCRIIETHSPCIVHSHCLKGGIINSLVKNKSAYRIHTLHNNYSIEYQYLFPFPFSLIWFYTIVSSLKRIDCSVACSNSVYTGMKKYFSKSKSSFISITNGVNIDLYHPLSNEERVHLKKKLNWAVGKTHLLICCRITKVKNIEQVLDATKSLQKDIHLIILGSGDQYEYYHNKYDLEGAVEFRGFSANPLEYLQSADFFVSASRLEGFSCSVLESLACGTPVILSIIPSHKLFMESPGYDKCISFFDLDKSKELKQILEAIIDKRLLPARKDARDFVSEHYSSRKMSKEYYELYKQGIKNVLKYTLLNQNV